MRWTALVLLVLAVGCAPESRQTTAVTTKTRMRGELADDGENIVFAPCGSNRGRAVRLETGGDLAEIRKLLGTDRHTSLYVEVVIDTMNGRFPTIYEIRRAQAGGPLCHEDWAYEIRAHGNEPFWSITVKRDTILFEQPDEPQRIVFPYATPSSGTYRTVAAGDTLVLTLDEHRCQDGMSGFIFPLTAHARVRGRDFTGCASEGAPRVQMKN